MASCPNCGSPIEPGAVYCPNCGHNMQVQAQPGAGLPSSSQPPMQHHRPAGITIIAILQILGGLALLGLGSLFLLAATRVAKHPFFVSALGAVFLVLGLVLLILAFGLWTGKRWAWMTSIILQGVILVLDLSLLVGLGEVSGIFGIILSVIIIYYLTRPHVKAYFQRPV